MQDTKRSGKELVANRVAHAKRQRSFPADLNKKFFLPALERVEGLGVCDVENEHAAVGPSVEGHAERLEALLACVQTPQRLH